MKFKEQSKEPPISESEYEFDQDTIRQMVDLLSQGWNLESFNIYGQDGKYTTSLRQGENTQSFSFDMPIGVPLSSENESETLRNFLRSQLKK